MSNLIFFRNNIKGIDQRLTVQKLELMQSVRHRSRMLQVLEKVLIDFNIK